MHTDPAVIWTIGHSTRTLDEFLGLLHAAKIEALADIRAFPASRRYPHFSQEQLSQTLARKGIQYTHLHALGGRRKPRPDSGNAVWRNLSFRGYADYMETEEFRRGVAMLESIAKKVRTAFMCSEAPWWKCHRALVADYLKVREWKVLHIMGHGKYAEHPFTAPGRLRQGTLFSGG